MPTMECPVIGIGAGVATDGQVLVFHDLLGMFGGRAARFVKRYADVREQMVAGMEAYTGEVRSGAFPADEHTYSIDPDELAEFRALPRPGVARVAARPGIGNAKPGPCEPRFR